LTYNYFRKGGYSIGSEDYRWEVVKEYAGPAPFFIFNIFFISLYQCLLLLSVTTPTYVLLLTGRLAINSPVTASWTVRDTVAAGLMVFEIAISYVADQQQWDFHLAKSQYKATAKVPRGHKRADLDRGFLASGLWAYSRHPNFTAEQSVWVTLYLWSCLATGTWYNWTGVGAVAYLLLFQGSTWLTELLTSRKYPDYKVYQRSVGKFLPLPGATANFPETSSHHTNGSVHNEKDAAKARERYDLR
jgi:steroid 5-alpha reductase family enzyme